MDNNHATVGVIFSLGTTLEHWKANGTADRECRIFDEFVKCGWQIILFTYDSSCNDHFLYGNLKVVGRPTWVHPWIYSLLMPLIRRHDLKKCTILRSTQLKGSWTGAIGSCLFKKPYILRCGYIWSENYARSAIGVKKFLIPLTKILENFSIKIAKKVFVGTNIDKIKLSKRNYNNKHKIIVVPNYVDRSFFKTATLTQRKSNKFIFVGRVEHEKRIHIIIDAFKQLPDYELLIVGVGSEKKLLESMAISNKNIKFLGIVENNNLPQIFQNCRAFVIASAYEGLPKAVIEALSSGLPVIAANVPGLKDLIVNSVNGLLVDSTPDAFVASINYLVNDDLLWESISINAKKSALIYSIDHIFKLEKQYAEEVYLD